MSLSLKSEVARLRQEVRTLRRPDAEDVARHAWFEDSCPCGVELGTCQEHPRARPNQRWPAGDQRTLLLLGGRASGKTRSGAEIVRRWVESGEAECIGLIGPTIADIRDTMINGRSGLCSIGPASTRPVYIPSRRSVEWPGGVKALCFPSTEPDRIRGANLSHAWGDEVGFWDRPEETWNAVSLALRVGKNPRAVLTTTPKVIPLLTSLIEAPTTVVQRSTSYENRSQLAPQFFDFVIKRFEGTPLGEQELMGRMIEWSDAQWFTSFNSGRHVSVLAEFNPMHHVFISVDAGTSLVTGAVLYQLIPVRHNPEKQVRVLADYCAENRTPEFNACAIRQLLCERCPGGTLERLLIDPAASQRSPGAGPVVRAEFERVFGANRVTPWPIRNTVDSLTQVVLMLGAEGQEPDILIHPRCTELVKAFFTYERDKQRGRFLDRPKDPQHNAEDLIDPLRGALAHHWPEGRKPQPRFTWIHPSKLF